MYKNKWKEGIAIKNSNFKERIRWHNECKYAYFICKIPGMGIVTVERLYQMYGSYEKMYKMLKRKVNKNDTESLELKQNQLESLKIHISNSNPEEEYQKLLYNKIWCIPKYMEGYPDKLREIHQPPAVLYVKGKLPCSKKLTVGVIGARNCSPYGIKIAKELGKHLAIHDIQVVSGMARGIDGIGQSSTIAYGGATFGILGCGVDICYPEENETLYKDLANGINGSGLISEYAPGTEVAPGLFPMRNRIISALSDVLVVVEAREKSGSFITVMDALEQGRDVYVVPGRLGDGMSYGCNRLISKGAGIIYDMDVFINEIKDMKTIKEKYQYQRITNENMVCMNEEYKNTEESVVAMGLDVVQNSIYQTLDIQYRSIEEILANLEEKVAFTDGVAALATLECIGMVESEGNYYRKIDKNV